MHREFESYALNQVGFARVTEIKTSFDVLMTILDQLCPTGREYSIAKTKLEEASFFAVKAVSGHLENQLLQGVEVQP